MLDFHGHTQEFFSGLTEAQICYRYAVNKWSIKEIVGHLIDSERVFAYRALRFARKDQTALHGYDEDLFAANSNAHDRAWKDLLKEFYFTRNSTIELFKSFTHEMLDYVGFADEKKMSVRAIGYIILGHEVHHLQIIKERYI